MKRVLSAILLIIVICSSLMGCRIMEQEMRWDKNNTYLTYHNDEIFAAIEQVRNTEYNLSEFTQSQVDSDTVQWICTGYSIYNQVNGKDLHTIGGLSDELGIYKEVLTAGIIENLEDGWSIYDRETALDKIYWLVNEGHTERYIEYANQMVRKGYMNKENLANYFSEGEALNRAQATQKAYREFGEVGIIGWDLTRALQVVGDCYVAKYINLQEALNLSLPIAEKLQKVYSDWEELSMSHIYGYQFWKKDNPDNASSNSRMRMRAYEELLQMEDSPFELPYDTVLKCTWDPDTIAKAAEAEPEIEAESKLPVEDGYYQLYRYDNNECFGRIKKADEFEEGEACYKENLCFVDTERDLELRYFIDILEDRDALQSALYHKYPHPSETGSKNTIKLEQESQSQEEPFTFYVRLSYTVDGEKKHFYAAYKYRMLEDGSYEGVKVTLQGRGVMDLSHEEAMEYLFTNIAME